MRLPALVLSLSALVISSCNRFESCDDPPCFTKDLYLHETDAPTDDTNVQPDDTTVQPDDSGVEPDDSGEFPSGGDMDQPGDYATFSATDE